MEIYRNLQKTFHRSVQMKIHRNLQIPVSMHTYTQRYICIYVPAQTHIQCYVEHSKYILYIANLDASVKKQKSWADCNVVIRNIYYKEDNEVSQTCTCPDEDLQKPSDSCKHTCTHTHKGMCICDWI